MITPAQTTKRFFLAVPMIFGSVMVALAAPAAASTPSPNIVSTFKNAATHLCLNNTGPTPVNGSNVQGAPCNDQESEVWSFAGSNQAGLFRNAQTGQCLTSNSAGNVFTVSCAADQAHPWYVAGTGGHVRDVLTGQCLADFLIISGGTISNVIETAPCSTDDTSENWIHS